MGLYRHLPGKDAEVAAPTCTAHQACSSWPGSGGLIPACRAWQVFNYIMQTLTKYRQLHLRAQQLLREGVLPPDAIMQSHAPSPTANLDGFVSHALLFVN